MLFFTHPGLGSEQFEWWNAIFACLQVTVDFWDIALHHGVSIDSRTGTRHAKSWVGRYAGRTILFPLEDLPMLKELGGTL